MENDFRDRVGDLTLSKIKEILGFDDKKADLFSAFSLDLMRILYKNNVSVEETAELFNLFEIYTYLLTNINRKEIKLAIVEIIRLADLLENVKNESTQH